MNGAAWLHLASSVLVYSGPSWRAATILARRWTSDAGAGAGRALASPRGRRLDVLADALGLVGMAGLLWAACATMTDRPLADVGPMMGTLLGTTAVGRTGLVSLGLLASVTIVDVGRRPSRRREGGVLGLLALFAFSRACAGHAGDSGLFSFDVLVEAVHLSSVAVWFGIVAVAAWFALPACAARDLPGTLRSLSETATIALAGVVASGLYNAWERVGSVQNLAGNAYGVTLVAKLAFVAGAVALGAYNRFIGFPALTRSTAARARVMAILRIESLLLLAALAAAARLVTQEPPAARDVASGRSACQGKVKSCVKLLPAVSVTGGAVFVVPPTDAMGVYVAAAPASGMKASTELGSYAATSGAATGRASV